MLIQVSSAAAATVLGLGTLVTHGFGLSLIPALLPLISADFGAGYGILGATVAAGLVAYSTGALFAGRIVERVDSRGLLLVSFGVTGVGLIVGASSRSAVGLALSAMIMGAAAPVSWAVTLHIAGEAVRRRARATVMAAASGGAAVGVLVNGVFVQTSTTVHSWRVAFVVAAAVALLPLLWGHRLFRAPVRRPAVASARRVGGFREVVATRTGRVAVLAALVAGLAGFPFSAFLTATALDEMLVSAPRAALLWWVIGIAGALGAPLFGAVADRRSPLLALTGGAVAYAGTLVILLATWSFTGLLAASVGFAAMNYPIWGLVGAVANRHFPASTAVRAIALGLVGAALGGAIGNTAAGAWIDASASFRGPVGVMAAVMVMLSLWYIHLFRSGGLGASVPESEPRA